MCKAFSCIVGRDKKAYWKRGLVPSFDGEIWRLHGGKDAKVLFEISKEELRKEAKRV